MHWKAGSKRRQRDVMAVRTFCVEMGEWRLPGSESLTSEAILVKSQGAELMEYAHDVLWRETEVLVW